MLAQLDALACWRTDLVERNAVAFLRAVQPAPHPNERLELLTMPGSVGRLGVPLTHGFYASAEALVTEALRRCGDHHTFFGVCLRSDDGDTQHVTRAGCCWADIDAKLWGGDKAAALAALDAFRPRPGCVVDSGGGYHAYWLLEQPVDVRAWSLDRIRLEALNDALALAVCGTSRPPDYVANAGRILRVPGGRNHKLCYAVPRPVAVVWLEELRFDFSTLEATIRAHFPWAHWRGDPALLAAYDAARCVERAEATRKERTR